jgi:siroheme synthase (precorrin-2 oxidase/ferrochelatase)
LFPVFLKLNNLHTVLVGGGNVGLEKLTALLQNSPAAAVTIISKDFLPEIHTGWHNTPTKLFKNHFLILIWILPILLSLQQTIAS